MTNGKKSENLKPRPPIVVVMGHVDHGKTTLLDHIKKTNVAGREAGGITQAVGAYEIEHTAAHSTSAQGAPSARKITFIDTPGHEAFSKMRSRGAEVADLAILVVAADEGIKPQTKEAVQILTDSKTPFIVAINKIDKTGGNIEKAKNDLADAGVSLEGWGGQVSFHGISAKTGEGVSELLDLILLAADLENLTYNPATPVSGYVLEVRHDSRRGAEATVILKDGILKRGETIYTPATKAKIKILENFLGKPVQELMPSAPAVIIGFESAPQAGEFVSGVPIEKTIAEKRVVSQKASASKEGAAVLNLILKASDGGSLDALSSIIKAMSQTDKPLFIVEESVGDITDGDLQSAIATGSHIIGFKVRTGKGARNLAEAHEVKIVTSDIIYDLVKAVEEFFATLDKPPAIGELEVLAVFNQKRLSEQLVGGRVFQGVVRNKASLEITRGEKIEGAGKILSLREKKASINQAETGKEIGLVVNSQTAIQVGDKLVIRK